VNIDEFASDGGRCLARLSSHLCCSYNENVLPDGPEGQDIVMGAIDTDERRFSRQNIGGRQSLPPELF